ncbi:MAG TPA: hypothetical protein VGA65_04710 [Hyphomicrobium sp.]|jgi:tetrahydrodipicolinate N-succinyltransferase
MVLSATRAQSGINGRETFRYRAVIVKRVDEKTRSKTSINELLRT